MRDLAALFIIVLLLALAGVFGMTGTAWGQAVLADLANLVHTIIPGGNP